MKYPDVFDPELSRVGTRESQAYNLMAAEAMAGMVASSLGPRGMEKMYVDIIGEETLTKHGGAFLRKMDVDHPAAKAVADAVNAVDTHVGDGTVTAAVLIGALLSRCRALRDRRVPTAAIADGLWAGLDMALEELGRIRVARPRGDGATLAALIDTCLEGKAILDAAPDGAGVRGLVMGAVRLVADPAAGRMDVDDVKIEEKPGPMRETELVRGVVIDKPVDGPEMPRAVRDARVLLVNDALEAARTKTESEIEITSPGQMSQFLRQEAADVLSAVRRVVGSGAGVVVSRKGIGELAQEQLARAGVLSVRRAKYNDLWWLEKATGASTCEDVSAISPAELGRASAVYERDVGGDRMVFVEAESPRSATLLLRAGAKRQLDEFHRTAKNALFVARDFVEDPHVVPGGGSCEAALARRVRERSYAVAGKPQLGIQALADALEEVPMTLARNAGMDALDALPALRSRVAGARDGEWHGIDSAGRRVADMAGGAVLDAAAVKAQVLKTAVEAACMILCVDDVFVKDLIDNTHCHIDGTVHAHKDPGRNHSHWEQEGLEQRQMHHYY